jgi:putative endonuclease
MRSKWYWVYILTNVKRTVLYTGVTNHLKQRIIEHWIARGKNNSFTSRYHAYYLLHYECFQYINEAIAREKEIKNWRREKKMKLIGELNPGLQFLNEELFGSWPPKEITSRI